MMIIWPIILVILVYYFVNGNIDITRQKSPIDVAKSRLAKGEISIQEYKEIVSTIKEN